MTRQEYMDVLREGRCKCRSIGLQQQQRASVGNSFTARVSAGSLIASYEE